MPSKFVHQKPEILCVLGIKMSVTDERWGFRKSEPVLTSETAQKVQKLAWAEVIGELTSKVPAVSQVSPAK